MPVKPIELDKLEKTAENIYEAIIVTSKRARQINEEIKIMMNQEIELISSKSTDEDEIESNPDMANISLKYEKFEKPTQRALKEMFQKDIEFRYKDSA
jgi:DNA-directed RNA polymerase subunit K/omega